MVTGNANIYMLGYATRAIEASRGGREGNNALINYDASNSPHQSNKAEIREILNANPSFAMLDHVFAQKGTSIIDRAEVFDEIYYAVRRGHRKLAGELIKVYGQNEFNRLHERSLLHDKQPLGKFMPIMVTKKAANNKRITPIHTAAINPNVDYLKVWGRVKFRLRGDQAELTFLKFYKNLEKPQKYL